MIKKILGYSSMEQLEKSMTKRDKKYRKKTDEEKKLSQGEFVGINQEAITYKEYFYITHSLVSECQIMDIEAHKLFLFFSKISSKDLEKIYKEWMNEYYDSFQQDVFLYKNGEYILSSGFIKFVYKKVNSQIDI